MALDVLDGTRREKEITLAEKVRKRLEEGAAASAVTISEDGQPVAAEKPPTAEVKTEEPVAEQPVAEDDAIEYEVGGEKRTLRLSEVAKNPEARRALAADLQRAYMPQKPDIDPAQLEEATRRGKIQRDIERGLLRVNEFTGQLEETPLARRLTEQAEGRSSGPNPDEADPLSYLDEKERSDLGALRKKALEEGDVDALSKSDRLVAVAGQRAGRAMADRIEKQVAATFAQRDRAAQSHNGALRNREVVDAEIAKFPHAFTSEARKQIARNMVATALEMTGSPVVDQRHLAAVAVVAREFGTGAAAPANTGTPQPQRSSPPPAVGHGARTPPGPPIVPKTDAKPGAPAAQQSTRPKIGSPQMIDAIAQRLQALTS